MDRRRRSFLAGGAAAGAALVAQGGRASAQSRSFTPEEFGAKGDGATNDTASFRALAEAVNRAGGGTMEFRRTTYVVGRQAPAGKADSLYYFQPTPLLEFVKCSKPLVIHGNGAVLRCAPGLRYGVFDQAGRPRKPAMPYLGPGVATPYQFMIKAEGCTGSVSISNLEIDGNLPRLQIGGQYGDTGWQIPHNGIGLYNNRGDEIVENVHCHHHGLDGLTIDGDDSALRPLPRRTITGLVSEYNGRQGCSIVGGRGYAFSKCKFNHTGRSAVGSNPGSGVDIEAEMKLNRDFSFADCEFVDNIGAGVVADSGDSESATFTRCLFVGTTMWSAWPNKPRFRFDHCRFVGTLVRAYGDKDPQRATQFHDCLFLDDPKLSPTGKIYLGGKESGPVVDLAEGVNVLFNRCTFRLTHKGLLPWTWHAIYANVRMEQASPMEAYPKGRYIGRNVVRAKVDLYGSTIEGTLTDR